MKSKTKNLLIVEDNPFIGKSLVNMANEVSEIGDIYLKNSLQQAISILTETKFKFIILDLKLPDGIELLKWLKTNKIETKVFVFSISTELKKTALKYGATAFFDKSKDADELIEALKKG
ncbi:MAG: response regulator [Polaribacter sp.]|nr:response regulator [Polaribacter sp.]